MRHEFLADVTSVAIGSSIETDMPPSVVKAIGLASDEVSFSLRGIDAAGAAGWYGKRVKVTIKTIGDE